MPATLSFTAQADGTALFEQLRPRLTAISRRIVGSQAEAEDVVQDCFLRWHRTRAAAKGAPDTPAAWLTTVVQHRSIDRLRKRVREQAALAAADPASGIAPALPDGPLLRRAELGDALARLLATLSPAERLALVLHEAFECDHATIAAVLGTKAANARQHLSRARRRLRAVGDTAPTDDKLCRELVRRFQAALDGVDLPAMVSLLAAEQPVSVLGKEDPREQDQREDDAGRRVRPVAACANDACYALAWAA
jgi:RNA polymerase sigma factor (sigma-70 family)